MAEHGRGVVIWDRVVRGCHWSVATLFLLDYWLLEGGESAHEWVGYALAALVFVRIVWGFVGSRHARFRDFLPTPVRLRQYLGRFPPDHRAWPGHNPLGALMVLFLWFGRFSLPVTILAGALLFAASGAAILRRGTEAGGLA